MRRWQVLIVLLVALSMVFANGGPEKSQSSQKSIVDIVMSMPKQELTLNEATGILEMIEEEKLARDVYKKLYDIWGLRAFDRISKSEQTHMDALKALIDKYGLENPVKDLKEGEFKTEKFKKLYKELVEKGSKSLIEAIKVGIEIEKMDIVDLEEKLKTTDNEDVKFVYENLKKGSENHLRSFTRLLGGDEPGTENGNGYGKKK